MTNGEKFRETFGVDIQSSGIMSVDCCNLSCNGVLCKNCTFHIRLGEGTNIWDLEYKEPKKINVGDKVKIINWGEQYTIYNALFNQSKLSKEVISHFKSGVDLLPSLTYTVLEILKHENNDDVYIAVIQNNFDDVYLIGVDGLEVVK